VYCPDYLIHNLIGMLDMLLLIFFHNGVCQSFVILGEKKVWFFHQIDEVSKRFVLKTPRLFMNAGVYVCLTMS
jgi:hypothetical protein